MFLLFYFVSSIMIVLFSAVIPIVGWLQNFTIYNIMFMGN
jgi:hypothetical protein